MRFVKAFSKIAELDKNLSGNEYQISAEDPPVYAAGKSGSPSGIPTYYPESKESGKERKKRVALFISSGKMANLLGGEQLSDTARSVSEQLKYEKSSNLPNPEELGYQPEEHSQYKKYMRSLNKRGKRHE